MNELNTGFSLREVKLADHSNKSFEPTITIFKLEEISNSSASHESKLPHIQIL